MATTVSQRELRNDSGAIMRRVEQGERFTVTRNGVPVADLIPHSESGPDRPQRFIPVAQIAAGMGGLPDWDAAQFVDELEQLDRAVDDRDADRWRTTT
jgi:prevent-host-death family protein